MHKHQNQWKPCLSAEAVALGLVWQVVTDFFDELKSRSRGYASMEYKVTGYKRSDLVRLDIKINQEVCPLLNVNSDARPLHILNMPALGSPLLHCSASNPLQLTAKQVRHTRSASNLLRLMAKQIRLTQDLQRCKAS